MSFAQYLDVFFDKIQLPGNLPEGIEMLYPFDQGEVREVVNKFYQKYYSDANPRVILLGINPGRFGAGVTGITFTDPIKLEKNCDIKNNFDKKPELSSTFVYEMIEAFGGPDKFYGHFLLSAVFPLGFVKDGRNFNYYDIRELQESLEPSIVHAIKLQISLGARSDVAFSMGRGKNMQFLQQLNAKHHFFDQIRPLPHPRWVMQYRLKRKQAFIAQYIDELRKVIEN